MKNKFFTLFIVISVTCSSLFSQKVGIGTDAPKSKLEISADNTFSHELFLVIKGADTSLTILNDGRVGIGISNPQQKLHLKGSALNISLENSMSGQTYNLNSTNGGNFRLINAESASIFMDVNSSSNIGLGALSIFDARVNLGGNVRVEDNLRIGSVAPITDPGSISLYGNGSGYQGFVAMKNNTTGATGSDGGVIGMIGNELHISNQENNRLVLSTNNTERVVVDGSGNVVMNGNLRVNGNDFNNNAIVKVLNGNLFSQNLLESEVPNLPASKITSGTFAEARIPNLPASKITSGTFANARISQVSVTQHQGALNIGWSQLTGVPTSFTPSAHVHAATDITSGILPVIRGGTGASSHTLGRILTGNGTGAIQSFLAYNSAYANGGSDPNSNNTLVQRDSGGVLNARGFRCRSGQDGNAGNIFNIEWTGSGARLWIDVVNVGLIQLTSDRRLKENIQDMEEQGIDKIMKLKPVTYQYKLIEESIFKGNGDVIEGFIADELAEIIPSAVNGEKDALTEDGQIQPQTLNTTPIISVLVKALQEQQLKIEKLEAKNKLLENSNLELELLKSELEDLKNYIFSEAKK